MVDGSDKDDSIHKVDTVPPPAGDGDAYNAETKVGPVSQDAWAELIRKANEEGERNAAASGPSSRPFGPASQKPPPSSKNPPVSPRPASSPQVSVGPKEPLPRVYDDADDDDAATKLNDSARDRQLSAPPVPRQNASTQPPPVAPTPAPAPVMQRPPTPAPMSVAPAIQPALALSAPPPAPMATTPSAAPPPVRVVRPLAFPPGDPAAPLPLPQSSSFLDGRTLVITAVICMLVFLAGIGVFFYAR